MQKVVISGSAKLQSHVNYWLNYFKSKDCKVLDYPQEIDKEHFMESYPDVHKKFFRSMNDADILFIMNEDKDGITGYIGYETYAELTWSLMQNLVNDKKIKLIVYKMPSKEVKCYDEIKLWLDLGWLSIYKDGDF